MHCCCTISQKLFFEHFQKYPTDLPTNLQSEMKLSLIRITKIVKVVQKVKTYNFASENDDQFD